MVPFSRLAQSQKNYSDVVALLMGKFLQTSGKFFGKNHIFAQNCLVDKETVMMVTNCPDNPEKVRMIWKLSRQSRDCSNNLETVTTIRLRLSEKKKKTKADPYTPRQTKVDQSRPMHTKADQGRP